MAINIKIQDTQVDGSVSFLNRAKISSCNDSIDINLDNAIIRKNVEMLNDLEISSVLSQAEKQLNPGSEEYKSLMSIKSEQNGDRYSLLKAIGNHLASFATGTLANIIAAYIVK